MKSLPRHRTARSWRQRQRGAVAIIVGLMMVVLVGFIGLALDGGHLYLTKTELQNGADACALAAAQELTGDPIETTAFDRAVLAGKFVGSENRVGFQGAVINQSDITVQFNSILSGGGWSGSGDSNTTKYVRCTIEQTGISPWFMQVLGFGDQTVAALATATLANSQTSCAMPLALCVQGTDTNYGYTIGNWYGLEFEDTGSAAENYTGNFRWIDFNPSELTPGCQGMGAKELACIIKGAGQCSLPQPTSGTCSTSGSSSPDPGCVGQTGNITSLQDAYNSRFGIYHKNASPADKPVPDKTGYSYTNVAGGNWPDGKDAYSGTPPSGEQNFKDARKAFLGTQDLTTIDPPFYKSENDLPSDPSWHSTKGAERRVVTVPIVECGSFTSSNHAPIRAYACVLMLDPYRKIGGPPGATNVPTQLEYLGRADQAGSPCSSSGVGGGGNSIGPLVPTLVQ